MDSFCFSSFFCNLDYVYTLIPCVFIVAFKFLCLVHVYITWANREAF